ncbi:NUDIX domain-containing protein [Actinoplanes sp. NPDC051343]|jgi:8-oxo-dGTP pyrophosphatase MutT (NUDIX family)|uniref:NUDIX hydrolase n=1 Tax=Actinoplanes sp. NPDC051343 TaxID=3363906 RepID=UPI0037882B98
MTDAVLAAGGVLYRRSGDKVEVCLVHRPRYDDWSLPKGTLDKGEHPLAAAVREVTEETGVAGRPQLLLPQVRYTLPSGRLKTVDFWLMEAPDDARLDPQDTKEVDGAVWLPAAEAATRLTYADELPLVEALAAMPAVTTVVGLVRHAHAGDRKKWSGNDSLRPIDERGQAEAALIGRLYALFAPKRLYAANPLRCKQTLEPLAAALGDQPIVVDGAFAEPADADDAPAKAKVALQRLLELAPGPTPVICSQGKVIPFLLAALHNEDDHTPYKTPKGGGWVLTWAGDRLLGLSRI